MPSFRLPVTPPDAEPAPAPERRARRKRPAVRTAPAAAALDHARPLTLRDADPRPPMEADPDDQDSGLRMSPGLPPKRRPRRGLPIQVAAALVLGVALGTLVGWYAALLPRDPPPPVVATAAPAPPAPPVQPLPPAPEPVAAEAAPAPAVEPSASETTEIAMSPEVKTPDVKGEAPELPTPLPLPASRKAQADNACAAEPSAADRAICADPKLLRLQADLRHAYNAALQAHQNRALLRERQLAWRDARNAVADPDRLAQLYEARIRKLNAATAKALRER